VDQSADVLWIGTGAVDLFNSLDDYTKGYRVWLVMSVYTSCVLGFSYRMYINSNCHDFRI
jgi:hypothetical protein